jgi:ubiquinol-cytochrome c reductase core subunit 2
VELIHRAAFRNGLANSLYAPRYNVHGLTSELLQAFRQRNFTANRLTLVGVGISHDDLIRRAAVFRLPAAAANTAARQATKYLGCTNNQNHITLPNFLILIQTISQTK